MGTFSNLIYTQNKMNNGYFQVFKSILRNSVSGKTSVRIIVLYIYLNQKIVQ